MPRTIEKTVFKFSELSDKAKETARDWFRDSGGPEEFDYVIEDVEACANALGIEFDQRPFQTMGGSTGSAPKVYWSLSYSQGDGASFEGSYSYKAGSCKAIRKHAPQDTELHRIADELRDIQRKHFYALTARMKVGHRDNMQTSAEDSRNDYRDIGAAEDDIRDLMNDFAHWIYIQLRNENDYQNSNEQVDESIEANEYEFDEDGKPS